MKDKKIKHSEHIIVFIDILGATDMIHDNQDENLKSVYEVYTKALIKYKHLSKDRRLGLKVKIFSDNILVSYKINSRKSNYREIIKRVFYFISSLYWEFSEKAILIRGGMTVGNLFHDPTLVWGEGLVRAYYLENKVAKYPRIAIDTRLLEKIRHKRYFLDFMESFISCADDGVSYFNWLHKLSESEEEYVAKVEHFKSDLKKNLKNTNPSKMKNLI